MFAFKRRASVALGFLLVVGLVPMAPADAQVKLPEAVFDGYATGTAESVSAVRLGTTGPVAATADAAFSGASVASQGTNTIAAQGPGAKQGQIVNEMNQVVQPTLANTALDANLKGNKSFGRGSGLEVGLGGSLPRETNTLMLAGKSQVSAPPSSEPIVKETGPVKGSPAAYASLVRGTAQARWNDNSTCILGEPISAGIGYAADAQLINTGTANPDGTLAAPILATDAPNPERRVNQSFSYTMLVPQTDAAGKVLGTNFGLMSETRQTIAPVTLFKGTANQTTIEFAGEWVLRAVSTGVGGAAGNYIHYGPGKTSPDTPLVRIIRSTGVTDVLNTQDLFGNTGLGVTIPGVAEIMLGEDPRAIGGDAASKPKLGSNGTSASAAVDVVRVKLLEQKNAQGVVTQAVADIRLGHMEVKSVVPVGGIACALPVTKTSDKETVSPGDVFTYTITVTNPFADCDLTNVKVIDTIKTDPGIRYTVTGTAPPADETSNTMLVWNDIGPIKPKQSKSVTVSVSIDPASGGGRFTDTATATGKCGTGSADGLAKVQVPVEGSVVLLAPEVIGVLAKTGGPARFAILGMVLLSAAGLLRLGMRRRSEV